MMATVEIRNMVSQNQAISISYWGERERAPTLLMSMEIVYVHTCVRVRVHVRPPDCACAKSGYRIFLNIYVIYVVFFNARS